MKAKSYYVSGEDARSVVGGHLVYCSTCRVRLLCLPRGLPPDEVEALDRLVWARRRVRRGEALFRGGDESGAIHAIRSGFFKTRVSGNAGREQVIGFSMAGELLGVEGIGTGRYSGAAIALEDSEVCEVPLALVDVAPLRARALQRRLYAILGREIVRAHDVMMLLGSMRAEERLVAFLLDLAKRYTERGYSHLDFRLRMTREELGSFLGLKLETVSRLFARLQQEEILVLEQRRVRIIDPDRLERLIDGGHGRARATPSPARSRRPSVEPDLIE